MKRVAQIASVAALAATAIGPMLFFYDRLDLDQTQLCLLSGALIWFLSAPFWMEHKA